MLKLKWQSFPSHLAVSVDTCYEKQQFVDLSLVCKDGTILKCHKMVLANSSSFFRRLLMANDHPHPMIILHDIEADDLKTIVNFMYCGEIQVVQSEVRRLLKLAEILEVTSLRQIQTSVLAGESNNASETATRKTTATVSQLKTEETRNLPGSRGATEHEVNATRAPQGKASTPQPRFAPTHSYNHPKSALKPTQQESAVRKSEEMSINALNQRLETGNSGISIIDINDVPSTSKGPQQQQPQQTGPPQKRKEHSSDAISWSRILSSIDKPLAPQKKLCIMDEVEITAGKLPSAPLMDNKRNEPLDRRKARSSPPYDHGMKYAVYIKDEIDISSDVEEVAHMDPLKVDDVDNENPQNGSKASAQMFHYPRRSLR